MWTEVEAVQRGDVVSTMGSFTVTDVCVLPGGVWLTGFRGSDGDTYLVRRPFLRRQEVWVENRSL